MYIYIYQAGFLCGINVIGILLGLSNKMYSKPNSNQLQATLNSPVMGPY